MFPRIIEKYDGHTYDFTLLKGNETYVFRFTDETRDHMLRLLGRYASNAELSLSWLDTVLITRNIPPVEPTELPLILEQRAHQIHLR